MSELDCMVGYEPSIFVVVPPEILTCPLCLNVLRNPKQCAKGHYFCHYCIKESLKKQNKCPLCQQFLTVDLLSDCQVIREIVSELNTYCITCNVEVNTFHYCKWSGKLGTLERHLTEDCDFAFVTCPTFDCDSNILRRDLNSHNERLHSSPLATHILETAPTRFDLSLGKVTLYFDFIFGFLPLVQTQISNLFSTINHFDERRWFSPTFIAILSHFNLNCLDVCVLSVVWRVLLPLTKWLCSHFDTTFQVFENEFEYDVAEDTHSTALATVVVCLIAVQITAYCLHCNALFNSVSVVVIIVSVVPRLCEIVTVTLLDQFGFSELIANIVGRFIVLVLAVRAVKPIITLMWSLLPALFKNE